MYNHRMANIPAKHMVGRPTLFRRRHCEQMIEAMATGLSAEAAAASVGISARCLYQWQHDHPEFQQAIQEGRQLALLWWERRAQAMAAGAPGSAQIVSLGLRNRSRAASGWVDAHKVEHNAEAAPPALTPLDITALTQEERVVLRKALVAAQAASERRG